MEFFLMFECAASNLETFWNLKEHESTAMLMATYAEFKLTPEDLARWVAQQCLGMAEALQTLHTIPRTKDQTASASATHGLHGDIKPANILRYTNWKDPKDPVDSNDEPVKALYPPLGVLQITDFGLSSIHHTNTAEDIKVRLGSSDYKAPEVHLIYPISQSLDIWTLGCLFLDFLTWLIRGNDARKTFAEKRLRYRGLFEGRHSCFFEVREVKKGETRIAKSPAVMKASCARIPQSLLVSLTIPTVGKRSVPRSKIRFRL